MWIRTTSGMLVLILSTYLALEYPNRFALCGVEIGGAAILGIMLSQAIRSWPEKRSFPIRYGISACVLGMIDGQSLQISIETATFLFGKFHPDLLWSGIAKVHFRLIFRNLYQIYFPLLLAGVFLAPAFSCNRLCTFVVWRMRLDQLGLLLVLLALPVVPVLAGVSANLVIGRVGLLSYVVILCLLTLRTTSFYPNHSRMTLFFVSSSLLISVFRPSLYVWFAQISDFYFCVLFPHKEPHRSANLAFHFAAWNSFQVGFALLVAFVLDGLGRLRKSGHDQGKIPKRIPARLREIR